MPINHSSQIQSNKTHLEKMVVLGIDTKPFAKRDFEIIDLLSKTHFKGNRLESLMVEPDTVKQTLQHYGASNYLTDSLCFDDICALVVLSSLKASQLVNLKKSSLFISQIH